MKKTAFPLIFLLFLLLFRCSSGTNSPKNDHSDAGTSPDTFAEGAYPSIPDSTMQMLWEQCDYVDYVFYDLDFSMSQEQRTEIRKALQHISRTPPEIDPSCRPSGRIFYQAKGENVAEADIYFNEKCRFYLFYKDGKKAYANALTPRGIAFYEYVLNTVNQ